MQRYTIFFIIVNALQVSGGFSAVAASKPGTYQEYVVPTGILSTSLKSTQVNPNRMTRNVY